MRFPDEGHGVRKLENKVIAYRRIAAFLEKHLAKQGEWEEADALEESGRGDGGFGSTGLS